MPPRAVKSPCRALIPLDTGKIRARLLKDRARIERNLWKAEEDWRRFVEVDQLAFQRWAHAVGGPLRSDVETLRCEINRLNDVMGAMAYCSHIRNVSIDRVVSEFVAFALTATGQSAQTLATLPLADWLTHAHAYIARESERLRVADEVRRQDTVDDDDPFAGPEDDDWSSDDGGDEDADVDFEAMFGHLNDAQRRTLHEAMGIPLPPKVREASRSVRDLYRDLCRRLHPDAGGELTPARRALWEQVQQAYGEKDVETLEALLARIELDVGPEAAKNASPSRLAALVQHLKNGLRSVQALLRKGKRDLAWGFSDWTEAKRQHVHASILRQLSAQREDLREELAITAAPLEEDLHAALRRRTPHRRKSRSAEIRSAR